MESLPLRMEANTSPLKMESLPLRMEVNTFPLETEMPKGLCGGLHIPFV